MAEFRDIPYDGERLPVTMRLADDIAEKWSLTPLGIKVAREVAKRYNAQTREEESRAIRDWIENRVRYFLDPHGAEMVSDPMFTLQYGGDCDDQATLCASLLRALGHDARIAAVQWVGRKSPTHCVCWDATTKLILDPISVPPEIWPPYPYRVSQILVQQKQGGLEPLSGFFSDLWGDISNVVQKITPAHTLLGKIVDPLGLTDKSRNRALMGRVADVAGTAALLVGGGYAVGAATGATGGFWSTVGSGYATIGSKALAGAKFLGGKIATAAKGFGTLAATTMAAPMLTALASKASAGVPLTPQDQSYLQLTSPVDYSSLLGSGYPTAGYGGGGSTGYYGGGGGFGSVASVYPEDTNTEETAPSEIPWGLIAIAGGIGLLALTSGSGRKREVRDGH